MPAFFPYRTTHPRISFFIASKKSNFWVEHETERIIQKLQNTARMIKSLTFLALFFTFSVSESASILPHPKPLNSFIPKTISQVRISRKKINSLAKQNQYKNKIDQLMLLLLLLLFSEHRVLFLHSNNQDKLFFVEIHTRSYRSLLRRCVWNSGRYYYH